MEKVTKQIDNNNSIPLSPNLITISRSAWIFIPAAFFLGLIISLTTLFFMSPKRNRINNNSTPLPTSQTENIPTSAITSTPTTSSIVPLSPSLSKPTVTRNGIHFYNDPSRPIDKIHIIMVYFVPKSVQPNSNWQEGIKRNVEAVKNFYERELSNKTTINYKINPEYISATKDYNLSIPNNEPGYIKECDSILNSAMSEIKLKIKPSSTGDLNLWGVVFEGLNCSYAPNDNLLVPGYIINQGFETNTVGLLMGHEFGHLLGIPDSFNNPDDYIHNGTKEVNCDIMSHCQGDGKLHSLDQSFLSDKNKKALDAI